MIVPLKKTDIPRHPRDSTNPLRRCAEEALAEFVDGGYEACKVDVPAEAKPAQIVGQLNTVIWHRRARNEIKVRTRKNEVFLERIEGVV